MHALELLRMQAEQTAPPGRLAARFLLALARSRGDFDRAHRAVDHTRWTDAPKIKAAVSALEVGDMSSALSEVGASFFQAVRARSLIGRIEGLRHVPANLRNLAVTSGAAGTWIKEGDSIPVAKQTFADRVGLKLLKIATLSVITEELARHSDAERLIMDDLVAACSAGLDEAFADPSNAGVSDTKPQAITNSGLSQVSSGNLADDMDWLIGEFDGNLASAVYVMAPTTAQQVALMVGATAEPIGPRGGHLMTTPVITSESVPFGTVSLIDPGQVEIATDPAAELSVSQHADIQMDDAPGMDSTTPTDAELVSLWQANAIGLMGICYANWRLVRTAGVVSVTSADYLPGVTG